MAKKADKARLDADGTAKAKTRIVGHARPGDVVGPGVPARRLEHEAEDGGRTPLDGRRARVVLCGVRGGPGLAREAARSEGRNGQLRAPHHSVSLPGLLGELAIAAGGVLYLDLVKAFRTSDLRTMLSTLSHMHPDARPWLYLSYEGDWEEHAESVLQGRYDVMEAGDYVLKRDGTPVMYGSELAVWRWLHKSHGYSVGHACEHEGYSIEPMPKVNEAGT